MDTSNPTRRSFPQIPAAAATLAAAPAVLPAQSPNGSVRIAFIGVGNRGSYLMENAIKVPGVQIVAICDIAPETLKKGIETAVRAGHTPDGYDDYRKMLERKDIDAVFIATPTDTHKDIAIMALEVGTNVYSEKPMALTPEECRLLVNAASNAKGIYQAGFQLRFDPKRRASMEFIKKGGIGDVLYAQGYRHTGDLPRNTPWYFNAARSGNNIVEQACHILDLFTWAIDKNPLRAYGAGGIGLYKDIPPGRTTMDNYCVIFEYPGDIRVNFSRIYFDPPGFSGIKERVWGSQGAIELAAATWVDLANEVAIQLEVPEQEDSTYLSVADFIQNARDHKKPLNSFESARRSTLVAMMGRKAIYEKRIVTWSEVDV